MNQSKLSAPLLMVLGSLMVVGAVGVTYTGKVKVAITKPLSQAAILATDPKYDINGDKYIDNKDTLVIANAITKKSGFVIKADLNGDKKVTIDDLSIFRNYLWFDATTNEEARGKLYFDLNLDNIVDNKDTQIIAN